MRSAWKVRSWPAKLPRTIRCTPIQGVLLKPLPYPYPESLAGVWHTAPGLNIDDINMAPSNYFINSVMRAKTGARQSLRAICLSWPTSLHGVATDAR